MATSTSSLASRLLPTSSSSSWLHIARHRQLVHPKQLLELSRSLCSSSPSPVSSTSPRTIFASPSSRILQPCSNFPSGTCDVVPGRRKQWPQNQIQTRWMSARPIERSGGGEKGRGEFKPLVLWGSKWKKSNLTVFISFLNAPASAASVKPHPIQEYHHDPRSPSTLFTRCTPLAPQLPS